LQTRNIKINRPDFFGRYFSIKIKHLFDIKCHFFGKRLTFFRDGVTMKVDTIKIWGNGGKPFYKSKELYYHEKK